MGAADQDQGLRLLSFTAWAIFAAFSTEAVVQLKPTYPGFSRRISSTVPEKDRPREALSNDFNPVAGFSRELLPGSAAPERQISDKRAKIILFRRPEGVGRIDEDNGV